jgi:hypothetical protein
MKIFQWLFGLIFGNNPLQTIADALTKAHSDSINGATEQERIAAGERTAALAQSLADLQKAREAAKSMPWWLAVPMGIIAFTGAIHVSAIFIGTTFAPLLAADSGLGFWLLHIPAPPGDYAKYEAEIVVFFFGGAVILAGVKAVTNAFGRK